MTETRRSQHAPQKKKKTKYKIHWFRILFAIIIVCGIVGCGVFAGVWASVAKDVPDLDSVDLDNYSVTSIVLDKDENQISNLHAGENRVPVEYDEISPNAVNALIAIEDQRFRTHNGIDHPAGGEERHPCWQLRGRRQHHYPAVSGFSFLGPSKR